MVFLERAGAQYRRIYTRAAVIGRSLWVETKLHRQSIRRRAGTRDEDHRHEESPLLFQEWIHQLFLAPDIASLATDVFSPHDNKQSRI